MTAAEELAELTMDIGTLEEAIERSHSLNDKAFLEGELERLMQYRHKLILRLKQEAEEYEGR